MLAAVCGPSSLVVLRVRLFIWKYEILGVYFIFMVLCIVTLY